MRQEQFLPPEAQAFFFGAIIMIICRPSIFGRCSTTASSEIITDALGHRHAQLGMRHFTPTETDHDLDAVALGQEAAHIAHLDLVVARVGHRAELDFLDLDLLLLLLGLGSLLLLLEAELAEVHDLADRWIGIGLDFDQIQSGLFSQAQGLVARKHAEHLAIGADHAHLQHADIAVSPVQLVGIYVGILIGWIVCPPAISDERLLFGTQPRGKIFR